ncbi:Secretory carrier-associated membrane protein 2 [Trichoplax sp. H2]|nr:Secretory carrier-associated membrane protein 2 [Trichoplax sp. H2]|eukprot:RDD39683.1 Secretory carrier-associated membrane protein 2 [Trichoplax sp. H2]
MADSNPFADSEGDNPFADPSITSHTTAAQSALEGRQNPFGENTVRASTMTASNSTVAREKSPATEQRTSSPGSRQEPKPEPAVMETKPADPPSYRETASAQVNDFYSREQELERKAAELKRKEDELKRSAGPADGARPNNFPPLPKKCCVQPCWYHDIGVDIPVEHQRLQRIIYYLWFAYVFLLMYNMICGIAGMVLGMDNGALNFALSIVWFVIWSPCSICCWYRPIYKAFRDDSSMNFMQFFFVFFFQIIFQCVWIIGPAGSGTCGFIGGAMALDKKQKPLAAMYFICAILATIITIIQVFILKRVHFIYRTTGGSVGKARSEWTQGAVQSDFVKDAVAGAAATAARNAVDNAGRTEYGANYSGNRY